MYIMHKKRYKMLILFGTSDVYKKYTVCSQFVHTCTRQGTPLDTHRGTGRAPPEGSRGARACALFCAPLWDN